MSRRRTGAIAIGVGAATAVVLSLAGARTPFVIGSAAAIGVAGGVVAGRKGIGKIVYGSNESNIFTSEDSADIHSTRLNNMLIEFWNYTPFSENNRAPVCLRSKNKDGSINISFCIGNKNEPDNSRISCFYTIEDDGKAHVEVDGHEEILNLNDIQHLLAIIAQVITDIYGEYDVSNAMDKYMNRDFHGEVEGENISPKKKLVGEELITRIKELGNVRKSDLVSACGYVDDSGCLDFTGFYEAIIKARIEIDPEDVFAYTNRGSAKQDSGDYQGAISDYNKAIEINPQYADAYNNRGSAKEHLGDYQGAIADYSKAIEMNPKLATAYSNRGNTKCQLEDYQGATSDFNEAIEIDPKDAFAYTNRGVAKHNSSDIIGAINDYDKALSIDSQFADAYSGRGTANIELGNYNEANNDYTLALQINPKDPSCYSNRGVARCSLGDEKGACHDFKRAASLGHEGATQWLNSADGAWCRNMR